MKGVKKTKMEGHTVSQPKLRDMEQVPQRSVAGARRGTLNCWQASQKHWSFRMHYLKEQCFWSFGDSEWCCWSWLPVKQKCSDVLEEVQHLPPNFLAEDRKEGEWEINHPPPLHLRKLPPLSTVFATSKVSQKEKGKQKLKCQSEEAGKKPNILSYPTNCWNVGLGMEREVHIPHSHKVHWMILSQTLFDLPNINQELLQATVSFLEKIRIRMQ